LRALEGKAPLPRGVAVGPNGSAVAQPGKWEIKEARKYNADADGLAGDEPAAIEPVSEKKSKKEKKDKKEKKEKKKPLIEEVKEDSDEEMADVNAGLGLPAPDLSDTKAKPVANGTSAPNADDSDSEAEKKRAKAARKAEKEAKKAAKALKKAGVEPEYQIDPDIAAADEAGLSLDKYKKKKAKELVKAALRTAETTEVESKKRKADDGEEKVEKKKKKKSKD
jgi:nucleolar protein 58